MKAFTLACDNKLFKLEPVLRELLCLQKGGRYKAHYILAAQVMRDIHARKGRTTRTWTQHSRPVTTSHTRDYV